MSKEKMSIMDAFLALEDIDDEMVEESIKKSYKRINEGKSFDVRNSDQMNEAEEFVEKKPREDIDLEVVDPDADSEDHLLKNSDYIGQRMLQCNTCKARRFVDIDDLEKQEDGMYKVKEHDDVHNTCPTCRSEDTTYTAGGVIAAAEPEVEESPDVESGEEARIDNDFVEPDEPKVDNDEEIEEPAEPAEEPEVAEPTDDSEEIFNPDEQDYDETEFADDTEDEDSKLGDETSDDIEWDDTEEIPLEDDEHIKEEDLDEALNDEEREEFFDLCDKHGIKTGADLLKFKNDHPGEDVLKALRNLELIKEDADFPVIELESGDLESGDEFVEPEDDEVDFAPNKFDTVAEFFDGCVNADDLEVSVMDQDTNEDLYEGPFVKMPDEILNAVLASVKVDGTIQITLDDAADKDVKGVLDAFDQVGNVDLVDDEEWVLNSGSKDEMFESFGDKKESHWMITGKVEIYVRNVKLEKPELDQAIAEVNPEDELIEKLIATNKLYTNKAYDNDNMWLRHWLSESIKNRENLDYIKNNYVTEELLNEFKSVTEFKTEEDWREGAEELLANSGAFAVIYGYIMHGGKYAGKFYPLPQMRVCMTDRELKANTEAVDNRYNHPASIRVAYYTDIEEEVEAKKYNPALDKLHVIKEEFKDRKELSAAILECKNNNVPYSIKRSKTEGYRYVLIRMPAEDVKCCEPECLECEPCCDEPCHEPCEQQHKICPVCGKEICECVKPVNESKEDCCYDPEHETEEHAKEVEKRQKELKKEIDNKAVQPKGPKMLDEDLSVSDDGFELLGPDPEEQFVEEEFVTESLTEAKKKDLKEDYHNILKNRFKKVAFHGEPNYFDEATDILWTWYDKEDNPGGLKHPDLSDILDMLDAATNAKDKEIVAKAIGDDASFIFDDEDDDVFYENLTEAKKDEEIDKIADSMEKIETVVDLVEDEVEAVENYNDAIDIIEDSKIPNKEEIISTLHHLKGEELEHLDELKEVEAMMPSVADLANAPEKKVEEPKKEEPLPEEPLPELPIDADLDVEEDFDENKFENFINEYLDNNCEETKLFEAVDGSIDESGKIIIEGNIYTGDSDDGESVSYTLTPVLNEGKGKSYRIVVLEEELTYKE